MKSNRSKIETAEPQRRRGKEKETGFCYSFSLRLCTSAVLLGIGLQDVASAQELFPFVLPWDDSAQSSTNVSEWLDTPAGKAGFVTVKDGHFFAGGKRLRIFGVNVAFGGNFPTKEDAPKVAARMAKFGINCVRFHHMDMQSAPSGIFAKDMRTLDPSQLDKLDWFIAKLKEQGIYADLNLHVSRTYTDRPREEKKGNPNYDKGVDNFAAALIHEQKDYARDLLSHVNPYTGNAYLNEPAVALIEINNENALLFEWWTGGLDKIAAPYRKELSELWSQWLKTTYGTDEKIKVAWFEGAREGGRELLKNGNFAANTQGWNLEKHNGAEATAQTGVIEGADPDPLLVNGAPRIRIETSKPGKEAWHVQLNQAGLKLREGESYTVTFQAKADAERTVSVAASQAHEPWGVLASKQVKLTPEWQKLRFTFEPKQSDDNARIVFGGLGTQTGVVELANVSLTPSRIRGDVIRDSDGIIPAFTRDENSERTLAAQRDWYRFLWQLEERYWPGMYQFLRTDLKARPLIVGTQLFWSPFPIQARMDAIDSHAYWQHPHFPGRDWDMNNWEVKNVSMAGAADGGTLPRLALQRVEGKPYMVSEYNHSAPNTFSSETFPLVCAYAALQDWDGIFAFAYSHRTNDWDKGIIPSFFDIDQHPTKMATLPASLALWLRSDVKPAKTAAIAPLSLTKIMEQGRKGGPRIGAEQFGLKWQDAFIHRVGVRQDEKAQSNASSTVLPGPLVSDTGELMWNTDGHVVTFNTARSKGVIGSLKEGTFDLGGVTIVPGKTQEDWATIQLTVLDGADFKTARRVLVTATGYAENSGMQWKNAEKTTVGSNWGKRPSLVEGVSATIKLPNASKLRAWALDERGQRRDEVPLKDGALQIGPEHKTLWYELASE
ncbi:carbohydrate binding domain-containing protein [Verrucomicrobiota bacterium sgz303538]